MSSKLPWVRNFYQEWIMDFAGTDAAEKATYSTLTALMYRACEPIYDDTSVLARVVGCSVRTFKKSLEKLIRKKLILQLENGNLWSTQVEEELKNCNENLNRLSERAIKAANTKRNKQKDNSSREHDEVMTTSSRGHDDIMMSSSRQHININNNSYNKKTKTIVLAKKEIGSESLETNEQVDEPTEVNATENQSEQIETGADNQPPIHKPSIDTQCDIKHQWHIDEKELATLPSRNLPKIANTLAEAIGEVLPPMLHKQESVPEKAKRAKANRGCRLPEDFEPDYDFAIEEGLPPERVKVEIEKFKDYWKAKTGKDATKIDWQATWRNWIRNSKDHKINQIGGHYGKPNFAQTEQQRGKSYRVAQYMSDIKNSDSAFKFLFGDDERTTIPLVTGTKTVDCRSGENYVISQ